MLSTNYALNLLGSQEKPTGKWVRGLNNQLLQTLNAPEYPFPIEHYATTNLRAMAKKMAKYEYAGIWLGKHEHYQRLDTEDLLRKLLILVKNHFGNI